MPVNKETKQTKITTHTHEVCIKSIEIKALFPKTEVNNELWVNFLQNTSCVKKGLRNEAVFTKTGMDDE